MNPVPMIQMFVAGRRAAFAVNCAFKKEAGQTAFFVFLMGVNILLALK